MSARTRGIITVIALMYAIPIAVNIFARLVQ